MDYQRIADLIYPDLQHDTDYYEKLFPERDLPEGAEVMRMAPSPTGFIHLGNLYGALADERVAHQSNGVFFLRIEDTDMKRKVEGSVETIISVFDYFNFHFDEGAEVLPEGKYGPYYQSQRAEIYQTYAKKLVAEGKAYPCFCTEEQLNEIRDKQTALNVGTGYYGEWAVCRNWDYDEVKKHLDNGESFVIRMRSMGDPEIKHTFHDEIKGDIVVTENNMDAVLIKADGIPTYHFAHAIDDHLMHTTIVLRGEEWLGTLNIHLELWKMLGFEMPRFAHTTVLMKIDENGTKRKLSKRLDPELSLDYYRQLGYHPYAIKIYLLTILNWNFEEWYLKHPDTDIMEFPFSLANMGQSGTLFDLDKLNNICKTYLSSFSLEEMKDYLKEFVRTYHPEQYDMYFGNEEYMDKILTLGMGLNLKKRRKDYINASQILETISFYFDEVENEREEYRFDKADCLKILEKFTETYDFADDNSAWFDKVKQVAAGCGFAAEMKDYKAAPENYKGSVSDVAEIVRIAVTGRKNTPDLWSIMQIIGKERSLQRLQKAIEELK
ncbi:MAG: glutamate--tRNA ligase [Erysipelotrichaceae bacterium]|nr:glutamate--tRNA ligase [Erysipelotrichaceae bacterium]